MKHTITKSITAIALAVLMTVSGTLPSVTAYADTISDAKTAVNKAEQALNKAKKAEDEIGIKWLNTVTPAGYRVRDWEKLLTTSSDPNVSGAYNREAFEEALHYENLLFYAKMLDRANELRAADDNFEAGPQKLSPELVIIAAASVMTQTKKKSAAPHALLRTTDDDISDTISAVGVGNENLAIGAFNDPFMPWILTEKKIYDESKTTGQYKGITGHYTSAVSPHNTLMGISLYYDGSDIIWAQELADPDDNNGLEDGAFTISDYMPYTSKEWRDAINSFAAPYKTVTAKAQTAYDKAKDAYSQALIQKKLPSGKSDADPKSSSFSTLKARQKKATKSSITIFWTKVNDAKYYYIYGNTCTGRYKKIAKTQKSSYTQKKLKKGKYYKYAVFAVKEDGSIIASSRTLHITTKGGKAGNNTKVSLYQENVDDHKSYYVIKKDAYMGFWYKGNTFKVKAKAKAGKLKVKNHRKVKYESSNPKVATVSQSGRIKAKSEGTCYIYAYAQNGVYTRAWIDVVDW